MGPFRAIRSLGNMLGLAWWAKVETKDPQATYWFGPFLTRRSLNQKLSAFEKDLAIEGNQSINHTLIRCKRDEPLTI